MDVTDISALDTRIRVYAVPWSCAGSVLYSQSWCSTTMPTPPSDHFFREHPGTAGLPGSQAGQANPLHHVVLVCLHVLSTCQCITGGLH